MRRFNSHAMKMTILFGGATHITPLIIGCKDKYFQGIDRYQLYVTQFKIQDLGLEDHIKVDSTS